MFFLAAWLDLHSISTMRASVLVYINFRNMLMKPAREGIFTILIVLTPTLYVHFSNGPVEAQSSREMIETGYCYFPINNSGINYVNLLGLEMEYRYRSYGVRNNFDNYQSDLLKGGMDNTFDKNYRSHSKFLELVVGIELFLKMYDRTQDDCYLRLSKQYGDTLLTLQKADGSFGTEDFTVGGWVTPGAVSAMVELYRHTGAHQYISACEDAARYLLDSRHEGGWSENPGSELISLTKWTTQGALYALIKMNQAKSNNSYLKDIILSADYLLSLQSERGFWSQYYSHGGGAIDRIGYIDFSTTPGAIILLLMVYELTEDRRYLESACKAADWLVSVQEEQGMWYPSYMMGTPFDDRISFWWDTSTIAAIDALLRVHIMLTLQNDDTLHKSHWFPPWPEDEIFMHNLQESLAKGKYTIYINACCKGRDWLLASRDSISCSPEARLDIYSIDTILLTMGNIKAAKTN